MWLLATELKSADSEHVHRHRVLSQQRWYSLWDHTKLTSFSIVQAGKDIPRAHMYQPFPRDWAEHTHVWNSKTGWQWPWGKAVFSCRRQLGIWLLLTAGCPPLLWVRRFFKNLLSFSLHKVRQLSLIQKKFKLTKSKCKHEEQSFTTLSYITRLMSHMVLSPILPTVLLGHNDVTNKTPGLGQATTMSWTRVFFAQQVCPFGNKVSLQNLKLK